MNLNNILGSDSISPCGYYPRRVRGNKRFVPVIPEAYQNYIVLYDKIPPYSVTQEWGENYPMVLELNLDEMYEEYVPGPEVEGYKTFAVYGTIHINPLMTRFLYQDERIYHAQYTLVEQSAENKTFHLYKVAGIKKELCGPAISKYPVGTDVDEKVDDKIRTDAIVDKLRGATISFVCGKNLAPSADVIELKRLARVIRNLVSAAVNNENHTLNPDQDDELRAHLKDFDYAFSKVDVVTRKNERMIEQVLGQSKTLKRLNISNEDAKSILSELGMEVAFVNRCGLKPTYDIYSMTNCLLSNDVPKAYTEATEAMYAAIREIERESLPENKYSFEDCVAFLPGGEIQLQTGGENGSMFINRYLNALARGEQLILAADKNIKKDISLALLGGNILKEIVGEKWEDSQYRAYINGLIRNLTEGAKFDICSIKQVVLQSFAAFVIKGGDIDRLTDFLIQNGIADHKYAWAMYGAAYGYSTMSKSHTNTVLSQKEYAVELLMAMDNALLRNGEITHIPQIELVQPAPVSNKVSETKSPEVEIVSVKEVKPVSEPVVNPITNKPDLYYDLKTFLSTAKTGGAIRKSRAFNDKVVEQILEQFEMHPQFDMVLISNIARISGVSDKKIELIKDKFFPKELKSDLFASEPLPESNTPVASPEIKESPATEKRQTPAKTAKATKKSTSKPRSTTSSYYKAAEDLDPDIQQIVESVKIGDERTHDAIVSKLRYAISKHRGEAPEEWINHFEHLAFYPDTKGYTIPKTDLNKLIVKQLVEQLRARLSVNG